MTFIVRIAVSGPGRLRGVVERVRTGRKEQVHTVEDIGRVIAAMALGEDKAMSLRGKQAVGTGGSRGMGQPIHADGGASVVDTLMPLETERSRERSG